ncbi:ABC-2 type transport system ATP-binding protein [Seinonella peptonophila]|uniref:ABC-2 type transport system ATP-binding protein n=1 Tax=Seinonella peptonophila TaxID=112248 RepID=A0A1M4TTV8_9BACL|nr:ABC transporter ATP-binding protein [Seinonella peptonophila]SHE47920.1 ABC-2 type transport system ATP-binding protein [Seinonella peptonophila]
MLQVEKVTGGYSLSHAVIHQLTFSVTNAEIVGLIGLNGAGKSTTIKHILGLMSPHTGTIKLDGNSLKEDTKSYRSKIAYIPEVPQFYEELTLWEHLELTALAYQIPTETFLSRANDLLELFRMQRAKKWFPNTFSKGMQQKIMILCAFLVEAKYMVIDEPFVGLDPLAIQAILQLLLEMKQKGMGILLSTHILSMAEKYCDRFLILDQGRIKLAGTLQDIQLQLNQPSISLEECFYKVVND